jgi:hypothetical protein
MILSYIGAIPRGVLIRMLQRLGGGRWPLSSFLNHSMNPEPTKNIPSLNFDFEEKMFSNLN